ncbi:ferredoxin [Candidatus Marinamargulisbacteria bacterium SCGC AAA071-K20]|nr:ferredoxin [Candidatus Marinamargulisbacteria bacterium SCGC AAA071-K20]
MAKLILNDEEIEIPDGEKLVDYIEEAGVPIGCSNGVCGTCEVDIEGGMENLSERNQEEDDLGMEGQKRLGCQCVINKGTVKITY